LKSFGNNPYGQQHTHPLQKNFEIGRFLYLKSEIRKLKSDFGYTCSGPSDFS